MGTGVLVVIVFLVFGQRRWSVVASRRKGGPFDLIRTAVYMVGEVPPNLSDNHLTGSSVLDRLVVPRSPSSGPLPPGVTTSRS